MHFRQLIGNGVFLSSTEKQEELNPEKIHQLVHKGKNAGK